MDNPALNVPAWRARFIIVVLAFAAYAPTLKVGFLWDDHIIIENNRYIQSWTRDNIKHDFLADNTQGQGDNYYRPFQAFGHRIDYTLYGLHPLGYHLSDLLVHAANGVLLYQLLILLGFGPLAALGAACLFVVNPVGIEQFIIPSGRTTPLSFFFILSTLIFLVRPGPLNVAFGLLSFILALLTKEISVITPAWVALVFYFRNDWKRGWVLLPMLGFTGVYFWMRHHAVHQVIGPLDPSLFIFFITKVFPQIIWHYVTLILWPWNLHSHHLIPHLSHVWFLYLAGLLGAIGAALWKNNRTALFCLGWVLLGLLPTIPVMIRGSFMLDHWGYPIALGILLPLSILLSRGWRDERPVIRHLTAGLFLGLIIVWSLIAHLNVELRGTDEKMYRWALRFTTSNPVKYNLGVLLLQTGRPGEATAYLEEVQNDYPKDPNTARALALAYWALGYRGMALQRLEDFERRNPPNALLHNTLQHMRDTLAKK